MEDEINRLRIESETETSTATFTELKTHTLQLLQILQNSQTQQTLHSLSSFVNFLRRSSPNSLQPFFDYTLFPLLFLLDAAIDCRSMQKVVSQAKDISADVPKVRYRVSDRVAEGVVQCLEEILKKCYLKSVDQMVVVLKKLTLGAMLSPSEASEEFREGLIRCFRALLLNVTSCSDEACSCKYISGVPSLSQSNDLGASFDGTLKYDIEQGECLAAFLRSQTASAAVGHWLSLLLKVADAEAERGHRGSGKLRVEAFATLRILVAKVGATDALAFFLPGVVSQIAKVLHVSKSMISGAAGSAEAINQAIRGLAEYLMIVLQDEANLHALDAFIDAADGSQVEKKLSSSSFIEELHQLSNRAKSLSKVKAEDSASDVVKMNVPKYELKEKSSAPVKEIGSLYVNRTKDWVANTSANIHKLLSATLPKICVHPSKKVRRGVLAAIEGLLSKCSYTMKESRLMLLESLCVLVLDDAEEVSAAAQVFLAFLFISKGRYDVQQDIAEIFRRLVEKLPKSVLGSEESVALSHAQQLLVIMYYSGPRIVVDCLLQSPVMTARFLDVLALCVGQHSVYSGPLDKIISARPSSQGFLQSVAELKAASYFFGDTKPRMKASPSETSKISWMEKEINFLQENGQRNYELPQMPPWFVSIGSQKLYQALAGVLRLVGLSFVTGSQTAGKLSVITDIPLGYLRKLISEVRLKESNNEGWQSWYNRVGSGQLLRQANTAACILNEVMFGLTDQSMEYFMKKFQKSETMNKMIQNYESNCSDDQFHKLKQTALNNSTWKVPQEKDARYHIIDCTGRILHEYLSQEIWDLPVENKSSIILPDGEADEVDLHLLRDTAILHQGIIQGIGIFSLCLGRDFVSSGFLHSSLYLLLENLISSSSQVRSAADAVLHVLSSTSGHPTVGHLVLANADYIIDSICRQLRHLDLNPHVPNILASMLAYVGVAHKILPLLDEPMRSLSKELEILGRHQHPQLTVPFLKAVLEITKATKRESSELPVLAESFAKCINDSISNMEEAEISSRPEEAGVHLYPESVSGGKWEDVVFKLNDARRYRRTVGSIAGSGLITALPLLASSEQAASVVALDIVEGAILTLAKVEEAYKHEKECNEEIEGFLQKYSLYQLKDTLDAAADGADENRLLPAANKIWPFIVACIQNKNTVVVRKCLSVVTTLVQTCGGDFFVRRFFVNGSHFWKLLSTSPFQKRPISKEERVHLQLPYRSSLGSDEPVAEVSSLKVQIAVLNMIAELSRNRRSSSALEAVFKKVSGLVVSIACSGVVGLRNASLLALEGLASIDPDLIWLLLADVYYSLKKDVPSPPVSQLPDIAQSLPPPLSEKGYLYVQYGGQSYGFDIDLSSVEIVFSRLHSGVFINQAYS